MQLSETCEKNCGKPIFLEELQAARNFSKISLHFNKILNSSYTFFFVLQKKVLQKQSTKTDLKVPGKSCDEIDDDVMKFILQ